MNENDSEKIAGMLESMGFEESGSVEDSDMVVFNTCCVRGSAEQKIYGRIGALKGLKKIRPQMIVAVGGCMAQQKGIAESISKRFPFIDIIFGTHNLHNIPSLISKRISEGAPVLEIAEDSLCAVEGMPVRRKDNITAYVTIMQGCSNFCSYCVVPYVRGGERSRKPENIIEEIRGLAGGGTKEIMLLGQNVNSYGSDIFGKPVFDDLLRRIDTIAGIERVRFMTSHPKDLSDGLISAMKECAKICEHIHLPVQAGSTHILEQMNRGYTRQQYLDLIDKIRDNIPSVSLTTDILVGFPGESEDDFDDTLELVKKVCFDTAYTFIYSSRSGTPAADFAGQIPHMTKMDRFRRLVSLQNSISRRINEGMRGKEFEVIVEGASRTDPKRYTGRTRSNKIVNMDGSPDLIGRTVVVKIEEAGTWSLDGKVRNKKENIYEQGN